MKALAPLVAVVSLIFTNVAHADNPVIVHEWGTFTSLQDENGKAIGGINVDDEPVPGFIYGFGGVRALSEPGSGAEFGLPPYFSGKGWMPGDQDVTMRLETPVLYFYPPKGASAPPLDVRVEWHGGILSQFYPFATLSGLPGNPPDAPTHVIQQNMHVGDVTSQLDWKGVRVGSTAQPIASTNKVWTTPRETSAPLVEIEKPTAYGDNGEVIKTVIEAEHFLFYRGVGHLDSPIFLNQAALDVNQRKDIFPWIHRTFASSGSFKAMAHTTVDSEAWLAEILPNGDCRWEVMPVEFGPSGVSLAGKFVTNNFNPDNLAKLKTSMQEALVKAGLYPDEASAMLRTWELSYFKSPGLRFFYIVPREWVDKTLPLKITGAPVDITRVMVGRIELISDEQKATLARLKQEASPNLMDLKQAAYEAMQRGKYSKKEQAEFESGARPLTDLGLTLSPSVRDYLSLGRFRDALIVHEQAEHPSDSLARFIKDNDLAAR
jgi:hypothetical protein